MPKLWIPRVISDHLHEIDGSCCAAAWRAVHGLAEPWWRRLWWYLTDYGGEDTGR